MKLKLKKFIVFLILLLISLSLAGCIFNRDTNDVSNEGLEIDYFLSNHVDEGDISRSNSLLAQAREKLHSEVETEIEEVLEIDDSSNEESLSFWDKLKLSNKERMKDKEIKVVPSEKVLKEEAKVEEVKRNNFLAENRQLNKPDKEESTKEKDNNKNQNKDKEANNGSGSEKDKDEKENTKTKTVTMAIRCDTAVAKEMDKDPKFAGIVPSSGVILSKTTFEIKEGDTVLSVLEAARDKYKIQMRHTGTKESAYVEGINNLYEFDGGRWSGWMYCVNGWYPNYGAGVYVLKAGDVIEWNYTCDLGKDLGQDWLMGN